MIRFAALSILAVYYAAFLLKMFLQRRKGISTSQMGKGNKPKATRRTERQLGIAFAIIIPVELICVLLVHPWHNAAGWIGIALAAMGVVVFLLAIVTMRDSWRAGIPAEDTTSLITDGIYQISRNPAFLGFDLLYLGLLVAFFHPIHLIAVLYTMTALHLQILQEEKFLASTFGEPYLRYRAKTARYLGRH